MSWWLLGVWLLGVLAQGVCGDSSSRDVRLPRELFTCLRWEFDTPQGLVRLPTQAKRWAVELSERGDVEIVCGERTWSVRVE